MNVLLLLLRLGGMQKYISMFLNSITVFYGSPSNVSMYFPGVSLQCILRFYTDMNYVCDISYFAVLYMEVKNDAAYANEYRGGSR